MRPWRSFSSSIFVFKKKKSYKIKTKDMIATAASAIIISSVFLSLFLFADRPRADEHL